MPNSLNGPASIKAAAVVASGRRRTPDSQVEQERRAKWGKEWGQIGSDAGKQTRGEA